MSINEPVEHDRVNDTTYDPRAGFSVRIKEQAGRTESRT